MRWWRVLPLLLLAWSLCLLYLLQSSGHADSSALQQRVERLQEENARLRDALANINVFEDGNSNMSGPSNMYELSRRRLARDTDELWWFVRAALNRINADKNSNIDDKTKQTLRQVTLSVSERHKALQSTLLHLAHHDNHELWRQRELESLQNLVQERLANLQNPDDCENSRQLVCNLNKGCGYGCQIHHAVYCFIVAYGTERRLVLKSQGWRYNKAGFEDVFRPLSENCANGNPRGQSVKHWPPGENTKIVEVGIIDSIYPRPNFLPPAVPADIAERLQRVHEHPAVWWVAQFMHYLLRPQQHLEQSLREAERRILGEDIDLDAENRPFVVGMHVRRTDKVGTEAAFHAIGEYMQHVDDYFELIKVHENRSPRRLVYVATDDPAVLEECRRKYSDYEFFGDASIAKSAAVASRYTSASLLGILIDIHLLSRTDFLVCTFSSQVCRVAYELMQVRTPLRDRTRNFRSLDDVWYFGGQDEHQQKAVMEHKVSNKNEMELRIGDVLGIAGNHWDGFNKGRNHRSNQIGLYPEFKVVERIKTAKFPIYDNLTTH